MRQTPTFSMSRRMVLAIAQTAGRRGESMSAIVREAVRAYINLDEEDRPLRTVSRPNSEHCHGSGGQH